MEQDGIIGGGYQECESLKVAPVFPGAKSNRTSLELANRCFSGYDDIVDACSMAWNDFISDVKRVTKMRSRDWLEVGKT